MKEKGVSAKVRTKYLARTGKKVVQYSKVQILQTVNLLPWSSTGNYMVDLSSKTTLILHRPLCLLNVEI